MLTQGTVEITAVDPLADAYREMLKGKATSRRTCPFAGALSPGEQFGAGSFDLVANSTLTQLDAPLKAMQEMMAVYVPGGAVVVTVLANGPADLLKVDGFDLFGRRS